MLVPDLGKSPFCLIQKVKFQMMIFEHMFPSYVRILFFVSAEGAAAEQSGWRKGLPFGGGGNRGVVHERSPDASFDVRTDRLRVGRLWAEPWQPAEYHGWVEGWFILCLKWLCWLHGVKVVYYEVALHNGGVRCFRIFVDMMPLPMRHPRSTFLMVFVERFSIIGSGMLRALQPLAVSPFQCLHG